jgi:hypothetical protein
MLIGFEVAGRITDQYATAAGTHDWTAIWTMPAIFALGVLVLFFVAFRNETTEVKI